ncbi:MAG: MBOAT family protein [Alphaproteobacteria bacterium]|nr:MBOAT family protein [Alphaproteobacteria bacterium]
MSLVRIRTRPIDTGIALVAVIKACAGTACVLVLLWAFFNDTLTATPGLEWLPAIRLRMEFNSVGFMAIFVPCTFVLYSLVRDTRAANWVLLFASLGIYATVGLVYLLPLLFTCLFDYLVGAFLARSSDSRRRTAAFAVSVTVQLSLLCLFKYTGWLTGEFNKVAVMAGLGVTISQIVLPLPPGISFYTFHTISYTADIYQRKFKPVGTFVDYVTFVGFFPQLIAGPIARASELLPQVAARRPTVSPIECERAFTLVFWGLFKKTCLADNLGLIVSQAGEAITGASPGGVGYIYMYAFAAQIYCDFSAYTDIARGLGKLFGIELTRNFLTPYLAKNPSDFWQRWHISLSRWLRDYLYIPLGGDRHGKLVTLRNLAITMFLGGLWHGAGVGFIIWGLYHGLLLVVYRLVPVDRILHRQFRAAGSILATVLMFNLVCIGWIFFRAAPSELLPLFGSLGALPDIAQHGVLLWGLGLFGAIVVATELVAFPYGVEFVDLVDRFPWPARAALYVAIFYAIVFFASRSQNEFIYFQF